MGAATAQDEYVPFIHAPESFDLDWHLGKLNGPLMAYPHYRRKVTEAFPLLFALMYADARLVDPTVSPDIHLSQFHIDMAYAAESWIERNLEPAQIRQAWIAPRGAAKSSWLCCLLPLWALAHGHRRMVAAFAANDAAAKRLMANIRYCLDSSPLLREDFPGLCTPAASAGRAVSDSKNLYVAKSGAVVMAYGIDSNQLGANIHGTRPDLILLDDVENDEGNWSLHKKKQCLATIGSILPMNDRAVVQWAGTTTMYGSATHDLVRSVYGESSEWVDEYAFTPRHYPAIVRREDGTEESIWPAKWPLPYLQSIRHTRLFALQYNCMPKATEDGLWTPDTLPPVQTNWPVQWRVLRVDPGVTTNAFSDPTGLAVAGYSPRGGGSAVLDYAVGMRLKPGERKDVIGRLCHDNPTIRIVQVETNQGGKDVYQEQIDPVLPRGVALELVHSSEPKAIRFDHFLDACEMGWVAFAEELPELREQMLAYPKIRHDDVLDAASGAVERVLRDRLRPKVTPT